MKIGNRRKFIKKSMMTSAGLPIEAPACIKGIGQVKPSDLINAAVIRINSQGNSHLRRAGVPGKVKPVKQENKLKDKEADTCLSRPGGGRKSYNIPNQV